jgi:hypothetical protein
MACITLLTPSMAMATTQLARTVRYEGSAPWQEQHTERTPLRMNWVVVTDKNGSRSLRMQWEADRPAETTKL